MIKALEFKNENGDTISIYGELFIESIGSVKVDYRIVNIGIIPYRKRKERFLASSIKDRYDYRNLPYDSKEREQYIRDEMLKYVSSEQLDVAVKNIYKMIEPTDENVRFWVR